jgi:hypothetical protein
MDYTEGERDTSIIYGNFDNTLIVMQTVLVYDRKLLKEHLWRRVWNLTFVSKACVLDTSEMDRFCDRNADFGSCNKW